jgi:hypothetical protein
LKLLNGTHQLLIYADDFNILGGNADSIKKKLFTYSMQQIPS